MKRNSSNTKLLYIAGGTIVVLLLFGGLRPGKYSIPSFVLECVFRKEISMVRDYIAILANGGEESVKEISSSAFFENPRFLASFRKGLQGMNPQSLRVGNFLKKNRDGDNIWYVSLYYENIPTKTVHLILTTHSGRIIVESAYHGAP